MIAVMTLPTFIEHVLAPHAPESLHRDCWLRKVHHRGSAYLPQIDEALSVVERESQLDALTARGRRQHPTHDREKDARFVDVVSECCGFAFAADVLGRSLQLSDDDGNPDFVGVGLSPGEAKSIHPPANRPNQTFASGTVSQVLSPGLARKVDQHMAKANKQLAGHMGCGQGFVFINVLQFGSLLEDAFHDELMHAMKELVRARLPTFGAIETVGLCWNFKWRQATVVS